MGVAKISAGAFFFLHKLVEPRKMSVLAAATLPDQTATFPDQTATLPDPPKIQFFCNSHKL